MKAPIEKPSNEVKNDYQQSPATNSEAAQIADNRSDTLNLNILQQKANRSVGVSQLKAIQLKVDQKSIAPANLVIQRFESVENARAKGTLFLTLTNTETTITNKINEHLKAFQTHPTAAAHDSMMTKINILQSGLMEIQNKMTNIVSEYEAAEEAQQTAFFETYLAGKPATYGSDNLNHAEIKGLFNQLKAKTKVTDEDDESLAPYRSRFLMFVLQGLRDSIGLDQYSTLNRNLGDGRQIKIDKVGPNNLSGGLELGSDDAFSKKTDDGGKAADSGIFDTAGSGIGFLRRKFAEPYARTANPRKDDIGHVQINMDRGNMLLPIFTGVRNGGMELFTGPKRMTVHHEVGHINSMLEGKSGASDTSGPEEARIDRKLTGPLSKLTDQEEMYNIWGGPRSDRAYGEQLGLPQRFDHRSMVAYYRDPTTGISGGGDHADFESTLKSAYEFTNTVDALKTKVMARIRVVANGNWNSYTKGIWRAPDGVKAVRTLLASDTVTLAQLKAEGVKLNTGGGDSRHDVTKSFYGTLAGLAPDNRENLSSALIALDKLPF